MAGASSVSSTTMMEITTRSSTSVNPRFMGCSLPDGHVVVFLRGGVRPAVLADPRGVGFRATNQGRAIAGTSVAGATGGAAIDYTLVATGHGACWAPSPRIRVPAR